VRAVERSGAISHVVIATSDDGEASATMSERRVNFGFLSTAEITLKVAPAVRACAKSRLYAIASRDVAKAAAWAATNAPDAIAYGSYDALLADPLVDAVYVPLPTRIRNEWLIKAGARRQARVRRKADGRRPRGGARGVPRQQCAVYGRHDVVPLDSDARR
jgi:hypothetical protein